LAFNCYYEGLEDNDNIPNGIGDIKREKKEEVEAIIREYTGVTIRKLVTRDKEVLELPKRRHKNHLSNQIK
jgi:hypothetical protein